MNKKLMLLGLCVMGAFSAVYADDQPTDTSTDKDANISSADKTDKEQTNEKDCGCGKKG